MRSNFELYADDREVETVRKLICDKCGKEIDTSFMDKFDIKGSSFVRIYGKRGIDRVDSEEDLEYDLCEDCTNKLVIFLKG